LLAVLLMCISSVLYFYHANKAPNYSCYGVEDYYDKVGLWNLAVATP